MTTQEILAAIKADSALRAHADVGSDNAIADALNATFPVPVPVSVQAVAAAAPQTMAAIASAPDPMSEMEVIASRIREADIGGMSRWADILSMLGKMPSGEHAAVQALVAAAVPVESVSINQVSQALRPHRPEGRALPINWDSV